MTEQWFPRPDTPSDVILVAKPGEILSSDEEARLRGWLYSLLCASDALEWRDKVGVLSPLEGSGKHSTRLLLSDGWVFKTDISQRWPSLPSVYSRSRQMHHLANRLSLWHPDKRWFVLKMPDNTLLMSVCPQMQTLRAASSWGERTYAWGEMLGWSFEIAQRSQISLDMNPSNFAFDGSRRRLYYLDDEYYERFAVSDVGEAMVARIPEYPSIEVDAWRSWGEALRARLSAVVTERETWEGLFEGIENYPLVERYYAAREALLMGLRGNASKSALHSSFGKDEPQILCVFSDVHGNAAALEAVLAEAKRLGAEHFLCLGDIVGYGPHPKECIERLRGMPNVTVIRGNHDQMVGLGGAEDGSNRLAKNSTFWTVAQLDDADRAWLLALPLEARGDRWLAVHGAPIDPRRVYAYVYELNYRDNLDALRSEGISLCFYGHTHVQYAYILGADGEESRKDRGTLELSEMGQTLLVNPGSVGQPRDRQTSAAFAIWDRTAQKLTFHRVDYDIDQVLVALRASGMHEDIAGRLEAGW